MKRNNSVQTPPKRAQSVQQDVILSSDGKTARHVSVLHSGTDLPFYDAKSSAFQPAGKAIPAAASQQAPTAGSRELNSIEVNSDILDDPFAEAMKVLENDEDLKSLLDDHRHLLASLKALPFDSKEQVLQVLQAAEEEAFERQQQQTETKQHQEGELKAELGQLQHNYLELLSHLEAERDIRSKLQREVQDREEEMNRLHEQADRIHVEKAKMEGQILELSEQSDELSRMALSVQMLSQENRQLKEQVEKLNSQLNKSSDLSRQLASLEERVKNLTTTNGSLTALVTSKEEEIHKLKFKVSDQQLTHADMESLVHAKEAAELEAKRLKQIVTETEERMRMVQEDLRKFKERPTVSQRRLSGLQNTDSDLEPSSESTEMSNDLRRESVQQQLAVMEETISRQQETLVSKAKEIAQLQKTNGQLQKVATAENKARINAESEVSRKDKELLGIHDRFSRLVNRLEEETQEKLRLQSIINEQEENFVKHTSEHHDAKLSEFQQALQSSQDRVALLETELEQTRSQWENSRKLLMDDLETLKVANTTLKDEILSEMRKAQTAELQLADLTALRQRQTGEVERLTKAKSLLEGELAKAVGSSVNLESELQQEKSLRLRMEKMSQKYQLVTEELEKEVNSYKEQLALYEDRVAQGDRFSSMHETLQSAVATEKQQRIELTTKCKDLEEKCKRQETLLEDLTARRETQQSLESELEQSNRINNKLMREVEELREQVHAVSNVNQHISIQLDQVLSSRVKSQLSSLVLIYSKRSERSLRWRLMQWLKYKERLKSVSEKVYMKQNNQSQAQDNLRLRQLNHDLEKSNQQLVDDILSREQKVGTLRQRLNRLLSTVTETVYGANTGRPIKLNLESQAIGPEGMNLLVDALQHNEHVLELNLSDNRLSDRGLISIANMLRSDQVISSLNLNKNQIREKGLRSLSVALVANRHLQSLSLSDNPISDRLEILSDGLAQHPALTELDLHRIDITASEVYVLDKAFSALPNLRKLDIGGNALAVAGSKTLATCLATCKSLTDLRLDDISMGSEGFEYLVTVIRNSAHLQTLHLSNNNLGPSGMYCLSRELLSHPSLTDLDLCENSLYGEGAFALSPFLSGSPKLKRLDLRKNSLGDRGAEAVAEALKISVSLETLLLDGNLISDRGASALAAALAGGPTGQLDSGLKTLALQWNEISDLGGRALASALAAPNRGTRRLQYLDLRNCRIGIDGSKAVMDALQRRSNLSMDNVDVRLEDNDVESEQPVQDRSDRRTSVSSILSTSVLNGY